MDKVNFLILFFVLVFILYSFKREGFYWSYAIPTRIANNRSYNIRNINPSYDLRGDPYNYKWYNRGWVGPFFRGLFPFIPYRVYSYYYQ